MQYLFGVVYENPLKLFLKRICVGNLQIPKLHVLRFKGLGFRV